MEENKVKEAWETPRVDELSVNVNTGTAAAGLDPDFGSYTS